MPRLVARRTISCSSRRSWASAACGEAEQLELGAARVEQMAVGRPEVGLRLRELHRVALDRVRQRLFFGRLGDALLDVLLLLGKEPIAAALLLDGREQIDVRVNVRLLERVGGLVGLLLACGGLRGLGEHPHLRLIADLRLSGLLQLLLERLGTLALGMQRLVRHHAGFLVNFPSFGRCALPRSSMMTSPGSIGGSLAVGAGSPSRSRVCRRRIRLEQIRLFRRRFLLLIGRQSRRVPERRYARSPSVSPSAFSSRAMGQFPFAQIVGVGGAGIASSSMPCGCGRGAPAWASAGSASGPECRRPLAGSRSQAAERSPWASWAAAAAAASSAPGAPAAAAWAAAGIALDAPRGRL